MPLASRHLFVLSTAKWVTFAVSTLVDVTKMGVEASVWNKLLIESVKTAIPKLVFLYKQKQNKYLSVLFSFSLSDE